MLPPPHPDSTALVTGASSGIGVEFARLLAERGHGVTLVARRRERLETLAAELRAAHGVRVETVACDLADEAARDSLLPQLAEMGLTVETLVSNAGVGLGGFFRDQDPSRTLRMLRTNVEASIALCHGVVPGMADRGRGGIVLVSSTAAFQPMPGFNTYAASKAALLAFAEGLHSELAPHGVSVTALCPGPVDTEFNDVADVLDVGNITPPWLRTSARYVAEAGLSALERGQRVVIPKIPVRLVTRLGAALPHSVSLRVWRHVWNARNEN